MKFLYEPSSSGLKVEFSCTDSDKRSELVEYAKAHSDFASKCCQSFYYANLNGPSSLLVGLGECDELDLESLRNLAFSIAKKAQEHKETVINVSLPKKFLDDASKEAYEAFAEGFMHAEYSFDDYKSEKEAPEELSIALVLGEGQKEISERGVESAKAYIEGIFLARDLVNQPSNVIYPETLAKKAQEALSPLGVDVKIYTGKELEDMGLKAYLSVAQGSDKAPHFIVMNYAGDPDSSYKTALVGKGLTYDSGGYSLKPSNSMKTMQSDMGGSATVIGAMHAIAQKKLKVNVVAVVAACENLLSGKAYKPGDIIGSLAGKTIEVDNTDAEGRLTLADAVYYATHELKADRVIDLATLTGACLIALGDEYTGLVTNNADFIQELKDAAQKAGEKVWELPTSKHFEKQNESKVADIKNTGGRLAGTITAGMFVGAFVDGDKPWIHMDIAGTAWLDNAYSYLPAGGTGIHVKTLTKLFEK